MATLLRPDGVWETVAPAKGPAFTLEELQRYVGGYIEALRAPDGRLAFMNENGKRLKLPANLRATSLFRTTIRPDDYIVGNVVLCSREEAGEQ